MRFSFRARNKNGEIKEGIIDAASQEAAIVVLQKNELIPIEVKNEESGNDFVKIFLKYYDRVTAKEQVMFFRQLAILVEARVPIVASLVAINEQSTNKFFNKILSEMIADIEDGTSFSGAIEKHSDVFSPLSINIIKAGETSGNLKKSIEYVADNIEKNYILLSRVRGALIYPCIILTVFFIVGFLTVSFILPKLTVMIKDLNAEIPWYTSIVISVGDFMSVYWWAVGIVILGFIGGFLYYMKTENGQKEMDYWKVKAPLFGSIFRFVYISRFAENLSVLLVSGIPIVRALTVVSSVINNSVYENIFLKTAESVKIGGNISDVLRKSPYIPPVVSHMIKIGEESGQLDSVLKHVAKFYDQETERMTKNLSTLIEPILMIIIGLGVGFMAFSILMPIYNIAGQIK